MTSSSKQLFLKLPEVPKRGFIRSPLPLKRPQISPQFRNNLTFIWSLDKIKSPGTTKNEFAEKISYLLKKSKGPLVIEKKYLSMSNNI